MSAAEPKVPNPVPASRLTVTNFVPSFDHAMGIWRVDPVVTGSTAPVPSADFL